MPRLETPELEKYALGLSEGIPKVQAYREAFKPKHPNAATCYEQACRISKRPNVEARVAELRQMTEDVAHAELMLRKREMLDWCLDALALRPCDASMEHPLCQLSTSRLGYSQPDKVQVVGKIMTLCGWDKPAAGAEGAEKPSRDDDPLDLDELEAAKLALEAEIARKKRELEKVVKFA